MAAFKVHGSLSSIDTQRVLACLCEKGLKFVLVSDDMKARADEQEPIVSSHPFGQVPALERGDLKISGSRVITQYIAYEFSKKGTQLISPGSEATVEKWMEFEALRYDPTASKLAWEQFHKPLFGMMTNTAAVEENETKLAKVLDYYETHLSDSKYLAGDCFSLADMHHIPVTQILLGTETNNLFESRPHANAWVTDITARAAWTLVCLL
ncbi:hypothetical protein SLA2020_164790 [Shorea laevis]